MAITYSTLDATTTATRTRGRQTRNVSADCTRCMLIGVDFEGGLFHLVPFDQEWYEDKDYWVHYKFVDKPRRKPKMKVIYGGEAEMVKSK